MVIPTSQWEVTIEFQVCILAYATIHHKRRCQSRFCWTLPLRLSFDASTPHLWRWMPATPCNDQWQEKRSWEDDTGETFKTLEDYENSLSSSESWEKIYYFFWDILLDMICLKFGDSFQTQFRLNQPSKRSTFSCAGSSRLLPPNSSMGVLDTGLRRWSSVRCRRLVT